MASWRCLARPLAHEDHAVRACYAALAMQDAIRRYTVEVRRTHGVEVQMRVGLNSGEVVVRAIGNDLHMDYSAIGQTTHLAARMEQLATPGTILLTAGTLRLAEGLVQVTPLGPVPVKGLPSRSRCSSWSGRTALRRRLQAAVAAGPDALCGAAGGAGGAAAGPGTGRGGPGAGGRPGGGSRGGEVASGLRVLHSHHTQGWRVLESASVSYGKATPYFPVIDLLKRYCHVEDRDDARTIRAKVTGQVLTLDDALQETLPALLALLDALPDDSPFLALDPAATPPAHPRRAQARAAARKSGAAAAGGLRRSALD